MSTELLLPDYVFEASWEVCNKVGGIYTVLSTQAKTLKARLGDKLIYIGPDLKQAPPHTDFIEDAKLLPRWRQAAQTLGINCRIGRWNVPGCPVAVLVDFTPLFAAKDKIYSEAWQLFRVDSLRAYGDYDEASMFAYAAGRFVEAVCTECLKPTDKVVYQAHEWMSGLGMLFLKHHRPEVATIFTTHATSIGRSITGNGKELYAYFKGYNGDQMAQELHMEAKHSIEKQSAWHADCFTTVSRFTDRECGQLLDKAADVVLPNGFEQDFVPDAATYAAQRKKARRRLLDVAQALTACPLADDTLIISTSGRNDYRCKGFDVYLETLARLRAQLNATPQTKTKVLALIEVPCWLKGTREDLKQRLEDTGKASQTHTASPAPLRLPFLTHEINYPEQDRFVQEIQRLGIQNRPTDGLQLLLIPCYLDGQDGIFNMPYYQMLTANDLTVYPSYYEPWGYTPLESCAFRIPCITTDLSGFGQWVDEVLRHEATLDDGVVVAHRTDTNFSELADRICAEIQRMRTASPAERAEFGQNAQALAQKAQWKNFIRYYYQAFDFALRRAALPERIG